MPEMPDHITTPDAFDQKSKLATEEGKAWESFQMVKLHFISQCFNSIVAFCLPMDSASAETC